MQTAPTIFECEYIAQGYVNIAGVDEAGRGAMAGPVVACAVILPPGLIIPGVYDSKKLSPLRRAQLEEQIKNAAIAYSYGIVSEKTIGEINILQASLLAMRQALDGLGVAPGFALIDGNKLPQNMPCGGICIKQGDSKSHTIAAASILAKEKRDSIMCELAAAYPMYGFEVHKGYGTATHRLAVQVHGSCAAHRKGFNWK